MRYKAIILGVALLRPIGADACSWPEGYKLTEAAVIDRFCEADAVFVGKVESSLNTGDQIIEYKIWPQETLKGHVDSPAYALKARDMAIPGRGFCDFRFRLMGRYLIFSDRYSRLKYLCVSSCDLSQSFNPESFVYQAVTSITDIEKECGDEATQTRRAEQRQTWIDEHFRKHSKIEELEEAARRLREADESTATKP